MREAHPAAHAPHLMPNIGTPGDVVKKMANVSEIFRNFIDRFFLGWYISNVARDFVRAKAGEIMKLEELKSCAFAVGLKETMRALEKGEAVHVFIASDADRRISEPLREACVSKKVPVTADFSKKELGKACGIKVKAAAACVLSR